MKKGTTHVSFRNGDLFCYHCGEKQGFTKPIEISVMAALAKAFTKAHAHCPKTWEEPFPDDGMDEYERRLFWLERGHHGVAAMAIYSVLTGKNMLLPAEYCHPIDSSDFYRCHLLLLHLPMWRQRLPEMAALSTKWAAIVENWDTLTEMLSTEIETRKNGGVYEYIQKITST